jgi:cobalt-zinc-cadmium efflux system outer membrane protein
MENKPDCHRSWFWLCGVACALVGLSLAAESGWSQTPSADQEKVQPEKAQSEKASQNFTLDSAIVYALQNNPDLATVRQQRGIAAGAVVIAETYPFNPSWEAYVRAANGPAGTVTNHVDNEHLVYIDVEIRHQGTYRRQGAYAAVTRVDWDIAFQELTLAIRVVKAFDTVLYRQEKEALLERTIKLDQDTVNQVEELVKLGKLRGPDLIVAQAEADDVRSQLSAARGALVTARFDFRRALGMIDDSIRLDGKFEAPLVTWDPAELLPVGLERRPDLRSKQAAVAEAEAKLNLERANRFGNPNIGPAAEYDTSRITLVGFQLIVPIPIFNTRRGEILQREAEVTAANFAVQQTDVLIRQDVRSALARLNEANRRADFYRSRVLPNLRQGIKDVQCLLEKGDPSVTVLHVVDLRRKMLKAEDGYLDAVWEVRQALADLGAAIGDPALAVIQWTPQKAK